MPKRELKRPKPKFVVIGKPSKAAIAAVARLAWEQIEKEYAEKAKGGAK